MTPSVIRRDSSGGPEDLRTGMEVELEHGRRDRRLDVTHDDPEVTGKIPCVHLNEMSDYYLRLEQMEREAGSWWG